ncbi:MAG: AAA family ATPase [Clostridia bacterium]|nr:AAA family ATPase [Clostridia bacterium]
MFTKISLKNFRSFDSIVFDLSENKSAKTMALIYGENGSGKTNLLLAFSFLNELLQTMNIRDRYEALLSRSIDFNNDELNKLWKEQILSDMRDIKAIIQEYHMVDSDEPMVAEYEFIIHGNIGLYHVEIDKQEIINERLEYKLNQRRGVYFDCRKGSLNINRGIIKDPDFLQDVKSAAKRFWGKHTLLSILMHESYDKSVSYGQENIAENLTLVLNEMYSISSNKGREKLFWDVSFAPISILDSPISGRIRNEQQEQLTLAEEVLSRFFASINSNIKRVKYLTNLTDKYVEYKLYMEKMISGTYRLIDFDKESNGNHQLVYLLCQLLIACIGYTVVLDEPDASIHDVLFKKIIQEIQSEITGQLILTTHNTMLMESNIGRNSIYILSETEDGHSKIQCISDYDKRTYLGNNIRNKYLNNEYRGIPIVQEIRFGELVHKLIELL